jgi:hypothetical protein
MILSPRRHALRSAALESCLHPFSGDVPLILKKLHLSFHGRIIEVHNILFTIYLCRFFYDVFVQERIVHLLRA